MYTALAAGARLRWLQMNKNRQLKLLKTVEIFPTSLIYFISGLGRLMIANIVSKQKVADDLCVLRHNIRCRVVGTSIREDRRLSFSLIFFFVAEGGADVSLLIAKFKCVRPLVHCATRTTYAAIISTGRKE